jgi:hypothetical protein
MTGLSYGPESADRVILNQSGKKNPGWYETRPEIRQSRRGSVKLIS